MSYFNVADHRSMALDAVRNEAYAAALTKAITPGSVVLDLGAGTGVLGLMAARLGAKRVYLVEPEDVIAVAQEIVAANGLTETVRCVQSRVEDMRLPEQVDIIVSAMTGNFLVTEDLLPSLLHARDTALKPGGLLVPSAAAMEAVPVSAAALHSGIIAKWSLSQGGVDLSAARSYAANTVFYRSDELREAVWLAEPRTLHSLDFYRDGYAAVQANATYDISTAAECHGWVGWFRMKLGDTWLSTSPREAAVHWSPAFLPVNPPIAFQAGERVSFSLSRAPFGEWTWSVESSGGAQKHSTLFAAPVTTATLSRAALDYTPLVSEKGRALLNILSWCDGSQTVAALADDLAARFPDRYRDRAEALRLVQRVVKRYA